MARIRTIKPEFWTDDAITECSLSARLLFIGMWNFADDRGNLERSAKQLKMKILPADNIDAEPMILELLRHNLLIEYEFEERKYLHIRKFRDHQIINRPSKSGLPAYDESLRTHGVFTEGSRTEGKGREGKGKEEELKAAAGFEGDGSLKERKPLKGAVEEEEQAEKPELPRQEHMSVSEALDLKRDCLRTLIENPGQVTVLQDICAVYPPDVIREAFLAAKVAGVTKLNWVVKRLEGRSRDSPESGKSAAEITAENLEVARQFCGVGG